MASHPLAILLPPSEGKAAGGKKACWDPYGGAFGAGLGDRRTELVNALAAMGGGDEKLLGIGGRHLLAAQQANERLLKSPTMTAGARYTGVVWDHLDLMSLPPDARRKATHSIFVLSGLLGAAAVGDPTPDYRLKMSARLAPMGTLSIWWRAALSQALNDVLARRVVIDMLANEHRSAWIPTPERYRDAVRVTFVERNGKVAGHDAKAAKGHLARHILLTGGDAIAALHSWRNDRFDLDITELA